MTLTTIGTLEEVLDEIGSLALNVVDPWRSVRVARRGSRCHGASARHGQVASPEKVGVSSSPSQVTRKVNASSSAA